MADVGRPTVMTPEVIRKIEEIAALDGTIAEMALFAGIHQDTIYAHMKADPEFSERIKTLRETPVLKARRTIVASLADPVHAFKYVERKKRKEFGANVDVQRDDGNKEDLSTD
jgi:hypothetical protein